MDIVAINEHVLVEMMSVGDSNIVYVLSAFQKQIEEAKWIPRGYRFVDFTDEDSAVDRKNIFYNKFSNQVVLIVASQILARWRYVEYPPMI